MRVPKGTVSHDDHEAGEDWDGLVARAKALAHSEDQDDDWDSLVASSKARLAEEERAWAEVLARAKRIASLAPPSTTHAVRPQRPPRPPVHGRAAVREQNRAVKAAPTLALARAPSVAAPALQVARSGQPDDEAEWAALRAQAAARLRHETEQAWQARVRLDGVFAVQVIRPQPAFAPRIVVAWP